MFGRFVSRGWHGLADIRVIPDALTHFQVSDDVWAGVIHHFRDPGNNLAILSAIPRGAIVASWEALGS